MVELPSKRQSQQQGLEIGLQFREPELGKPPETRRNPERSHALWPLPCDGGAVVKRFLIKEIKKLKNQKKLLSKRKNNFENLKKICPAEVPTTRNKKILAYRNFRRRKLKKITLSELPTTRIFFRGAWRNFRQQKKFIFKKCWYFSAKIFFGF